ncbi:MAG: hypothetical protein GX483_07840 [Actinomycetaceae bacterium]|nr:hypothetical protein [Actinomycetaceae bacterium]
MKSVFAHRDEHERRSTIYFLILFSVSFVCGVVGSAMVYGTAGPWHERIIQTLYSTGRLYVFEGTLDIEIGPWPYEIARWAAPATTVVGIFAIFESLLWQARQRVRRAKKGHVTVLGSNEETLIFVNNLREEYPDQTIQVIVPDDVDEIFIRRLQSSRALVRMMRFEHPSSGRFKRALRRLNLDDARAVVSFEDEPASFAHIRVISRALGDLKQRIAVYIESNDRRIQTIVKDVMDDCPNMNVNYFSARELVTSALIDDPAFTIVPRHESTDRPALARTYRDVAQVVPSPHFLIIGFASLGQDMVLHLTNSAVTNPIAPIRFTIVDPEVELRWENFIARRPEHERVMSVRRVATSTENQLFTDLVKEISETDPPTAVLYCQPDTQESILSIDFVARYIQDAKVAVYSPAHDQHEILTEAISARGIDVVFFGDLDDSLTGTNVFSESLYQRAKDFNVEYSRAYAQVESRALSSAEQLEQLVKEAHSQWELLDAFKKESSLAQARHESTKAWVLGVLNDKFVNTSVAQVVADWKRQLVDAPGQGQERVENQVRVIEADPLMNYMCALEHKRWANFHYMRGYSYGEFSDVGRTHPSLVDDWDEFLTNEDLRGKTGTPLRYQVIYDMLSVLLVADERL